MKYPINIRKNEYGEYVVRCQPVFANEAPAVYYASDLSDAIGSAVLIACEQGHNLFEDQPFRWSVCDAYVRPVYVTVRGKPVASLLPYRRH